MFRTGFSLQFVINIKKNRVNPDFFSNHDNIEIKHIFIEIY